MRDRVRAEKPNVVDFTWIYQAHGEEMTSIDAGACKPSRLVGMDDDGWADRCQHWAAPVPEKRPNGTTPRRRHQPLVLTGHGLGLRVDQGALVVKDGFTHYPQVQGIHRFFPRDRNMPSR